MYNHNRHAGQANLLLGDERAHEDYYPKQKVIRNSSNGVEIGKIFQHIAQRITTFW